MKPNSLKTTKLTITAEKDVYAVYTNIDLTDGYGSQYLLYLAETETTASRLSKRRGVQGCDADVRRVKMYCIQNIGWYAPSISITVPTSDDIAAEKLLNETRAKDILLDKFKKGEALSENEREKILELLKNSK